MLQHSHTTMAACCRQPNRMSDRPYPPCTACPDAASSLVPHFISVSACRGAINAYTRALELQPKQPSLWSNRAACHLALGQAAECLQDSDAAVELLQAAQQQLQQAAGHPGAEQEVLAGLLPAAAAAAAAAGAGGAGGAAEQQRAELGELEAAPTSSEQQVQQTHLEDAALAASAVQQPDASSGGSSSSSDVGAAGKLQRQLAKVLARRAAAHVELMQLQQGWEDLQQALRWGSCSVLQAFAVNRCSSQQHVCVM